MSYQVIARKWRPQTFEEVTGQEVITHTLRNAIEHDRLHHAYLFSGARGVGKTTTARLLAKSLNCHKTAGPNLVPCSITDETICPSCLEISESRSIDVLEIDAASHTGIGDVRETIIESINFNPARDRFKVFIIDEVHQLSKPAFNALLKTLEEPPERVVFIMATTELHKVPDTIVSRCQEFQFRTIPLPKIFDRLRLIADAEKIDITDDALREISRSGEGSMRDAQSNFDQVISFSGEKITSEDVTKALGFAGVDILRRVIAAIADRNSSEMLSVVDDLTVRGHDLRNFCRDLLGIFRDLLVYKVSGNDEKLIEGSAFAADDLKQFSAGFTEADLLRFFNSTAETEASLKDASHARYVLEIGLVKLVEMRRVESVEALLKRLDQIVNNGGAAEQPSEEKKTPNLEPEAENAPIAADEPAEPLEREFIEEPPEDHFDDPPVHRLKTQDPPATLAIAHDLRSMPIRLPPIAAEELEHVEVAALDSAYEEKLVLTGDDLGPFGSAHELVAAVLGESLERHLSRPSQPSNGATAAATAPAYEAIDLSTLDDIEDESGEIPVLGENPTEEELLAYASSHPYVKRALKIFRGTIVSVELTDQHPK